MDNGIPKVFESDGGPQFVSIGFLSRYQKYFSTLDAIIGYWQVPLAEKSQELTTFITPWGRYKHL